MRSARKYTVHNVPEHMYKDGCELGRPEAQPITKKASQARSCGHFFWKKHDKTL